MPRLLILHVEDREDEAALIHLGLNYACDVDVAATIREALSMIAKRTYYAILLDLSLPDSEDLSGVRAIRAAVQSSSEPIPVVVLTGADGGTCDENIQRARDAGADWWIDKGTSGREIVRTIKLVKSHLYVAPLRGAPA